MNLHFLHGGILGIWAVYHVFSGFKGWFFYKINNRKGFYFLMNAVWGIINFGVAVFVAFHPYFFSLNKFNAEHPVKMMQLNIKSDLFYILIGIILWLCHKLMKRYPQLWSGFGLAIIFQGGFLLVLDVVFWILYREILKR